MMGRGGAKLGEKTREARGSVSLNGAKSQGVPSSSFSDTSARFPSLPSALRCSCFISSFATVCSLLFNLLSRQSRDHHITITRVYQVWNRCGSGMRG
jgi:hypothetical protein